jgi:hypothetical protein
MPAGHFQTGKAGRYKRCKHTLPEVVQIASDDRRYRVNAAATITDAVNGRVSYSWGANDLAQSGTFIAQWEVTYPGGRVQTTVGEVEVTVRRQ